jgi:ferritin-like metal-binding protein YciE
MTPSSLEEQLTKYLTDAHSIEQQALAQLRSAPEIAGDPELARAFSEHLTETEGHERLVRERLAAHDAEPAKLKDLFGTITGKGFVAFARSQPDTPGKLTAHAFSYEHMELAAYELLARVAERAGDSETAAVARRIAGEERRMAQRLADGFDAAVDAALRDQSPDDMREQLTKYLTDAHAIESQALQLLAKGPDIAGDPELAQAFADHRGETEGHRRMIAERLEDLGAEPSRVKDAAMRLGALNWGAFFQAQPDTPAKLAGFAYAFEHLEIAAYELLERTARRASDQETFAAAEQILAEERAAASRLHELFDAALDASLEAQGLAAAR